jgi:hypothetical protein
MYAKTFKSILEVSYDGYNKSMLIIVNSWALAYEGKMWLINGLGKKSLCTRNGTFLGWGEENMCLHEITWKQSKSIIERNVDTSK